MQKLDVEESYVNTSRVAKNENSIWNSPMNHVSADPNASPMTRLRGAGSNTKLNSPHPSASQGGFAIKMQSVPKISITQNAAERDRQELREAKMHKKEFVNFVSNILTKHKESKHQKDNLPGPFEPGQATSDTEPPTVDDIGNFISDKVGSVVKPAKKKPANQDKQQAAART